MATAAGTGPSVTIPPTGGALSTPVHQFPARLSVTVGNHLAIDAASIRATVNVGGNFSYLFLPPLVAGEAARSSKSTAGELLVQADIEPDADGDGFGDETQDGCPSQSTTEAACDNKPPAVSRLRVAGRRVRYRLSEASTVRFQVQRAIPGRRVQRRMPARDPPEPQPPELHALRGAGRRVQRPRQRGSQPALAAQAPWRSLARAAGGSGS